MKKRILFTGGGGAATESLWRSLSDRYDIYFADACAESITDTVPDDRKISIPFANSEGFVAAIKDTCDNYQIDTVVPGVDEELLVLSKNRDSDMPYVLLPSDEFIVLMLDKFKCAKAIKEKGLNAPETLEVSRAREIGFPLIVKPKTGRGSRGVCVLNSELEIEAYKVLHQVNSEDIIAQELKKGTEYTVLVGANRAAELKALVPVKIDLKSGITIRAETDVNESVIEYSKRFHEQFRPTGIYNIQCILTAEGEVYPFEVNPRVSTTFCLGVAAGFDPFSTNFEESSEFFLPHNKYSLKRNWFNSIKRVR